MRTYKTEGIILKRRNLGETDRILTVFSQIDGKIQVKAPGVRKITSRRAPHVEGLNLSIFSLYKSSRSSLAFVTEAETLENFSSVKNDLAKIGYAYYICELINGLCAEGQENRGVFSLLKATLCALSRDSQVNLIVKFFEKELLAHLGFWGEAKMLQTEDSRIVMERLLERKLKTSCVMPLFAQV